MGLIFIAILLGIIPILSFIFQYLLSKKNGDLNAFRNNTQVYYYDWFFIPFNLIYIYAITINIYLVLVLSLLALIGNLYFHFHYWLNIHLKEKKKAHMYNLKEKRLSSAGNVHFIFSTFQTIIVTYFLFSSIKLPIGYFGLFFLGLFFASFFFTSKKLHGKMIKGDIIVGSIGILSVFLKVIFQH